MRILIAMTLIIGLIVTYFMTGRTPQLTAPIAIAPVLHNSRATMIASNHLHLEHLKLAELRHHSKVLPTHERVVLSHREKEILLNSNQRFSQDTLVLLAEVRSPVWKNHKLQASDLFISEVSTNKKIFVSYSTRGEPFIGAVQILEIPENGNIPRLLQTVIFTDFDIHSLTEKNGKLYLAGATGDEKFKTPAALEIIQLVNGLIQLPLVSKRIDLPSFAATSVIKVKNQIFVATGNQDGGVIEINNPNSIKNGLSYYKNLNYQLYDLDDARYLDYSKDNIYCVKGTNGGLWVMDRASRRSQLIDLSGATIAESKSTVEIAGDNILLAMGDGGTQVLNGKSLKMVNSIPQAPHHNLSLSVTNAASGHFKEIFTADGEAGASIFVTDSKGKLQQLAGMHFGAGKSVNAIKYFDGYLVMASGMAGVKIAKLFRNDLKINKDEQLYYANDLKRRLADD